MANIQTTSWIIETKKEFDQNLGIYAKEQANNLLIARRYQFCF